MKKVIIITGPGGVGKTTIAKLLRKEHGYILLDGDSEDTEFFPKGGQWLSKNSSKLKKAHNKIFNKTKELVQNGNNVIVDYIIFDYYLEFFNKFDKEFGDELQIIILFPKKSEIIIRDSKRKCWTTGAEHINIIYNK